MFIFDLAVTVPDVMFVAAAMAIDTILELADTFFDMLPADTGWRVFMASVASEAAIVAAGMAGDTTWVVR